MMKIMLDTQIYDRIIDKPEIMDRLNKFSIEGKVIVLCTHIQQDELACIPDDRKRTAVSGIIQKEVPTNGAVCGVSKCDQATCGDGSSSGVSIDDIRSTSKKHTKDALIATTATLNADVFVTEDRRLANRMRSVHSSCAIWGFDQLKNYLFQ